MSFSLQYGYNDNSEEPDKMSSGFQLVMIVFGFGMFSISFDRTSVLMYGTKKRTRWSFLLDSRYLLIFS